MALELETQIMMEIGLGNHYSWYNGSPSCRYIRIQATKRLAEKIQIHHDRGEEIAAPNYNLICTLRSIADEGEDSELTKTWEMASYIIAEHIHQANIPQEEKKKAFERLNEYLREHYISKETKDKVYMDDHIMITFWMRKKDETKSR